MMRWSDNAIVRELQQAIYAAFDKGFDPEGVIEQIQPIWEQWKGDVAEEEALQEAQNHEPRCPDCGADPYGSHEAEGCP